MKEIGGGDVVVVVIVTVELAIDVDAYVCLVSDVRVEAVVCDILVVLFEKFVVSDVFVVIDDVVTDVTVCVVLYVAIDEFVVVAIVLETEAVLVLDDLINCGIMEVDVTVLFCNNVSFAGATDDVCVKIVVNCGVIVVVVAALRDITVAVTDVVDDVFAKEITT